MEWDEFRKMVGRICGYWERKIPSEEQGLEWFEAVKWIPEGNGERIFEKFRRMEARPVNIPLRIQEVYKSFQSEPGKNTDFLISMIMKNAQDNDFNYLESFYDLRGAIKRRNINIGAAMRWLKSEGFWVDLKRLDEPSCIDFGQLRAWLDNPGRLRMKDDPVLVGEILGDEDIPS